MLGHFNARLFEKSARKPEMTLHGQMRTRSGCWVAKEIGCTVASKASVRSDHRLRSVSADVSFTKEVGTLLGNDVLR